MNGKQKCVNFKTCQGYAEAGRSKCWCCLEAEKEVEATRIEKQLNQQEKKPHNVNDIWRWK